MKLLFDENPSPRLAEALQGPYPQSTHVESVGLRGQSFMADENEALLVLHPPVS